MSSDKQLFSQHYDLLLLPKKFGCYLKEPVKIMNCMHFVTLTTNIDYFIKISCDYA